MDSKKKVPARTKRPVSSDSIVADDYAVEGVERNELFDKLLCACVEKHGVYLTKEIYKKIRTIIEERNKFIEEWDHHCG